MKKLDKHVSFGIDPNKMQPKAIEPFRIDRAHANGTVVIHHTPFMLDCLNIRGRLPIPYPTSGYLKGQCYYVRNHTYVKTHISLK
jgi:hypothetical protein